MKKLSDGGPAFPHDGGITTGGEPIRESEGMSLRDYFAAAALQGLCANPSLRLFDETNTAAAAYNHADAMLAARNETRMVQRTALQG